MYIPIYIHTHIHDSDNNNDNKTLLIMIILLIMILLLSLLLRAGQASARHGGLPEPPEPAVRPGPDFCNYDNNVYYY